MVTIMTVFLQPFRGKEGVFDVRTRLWGEGCCIEAAASTRSLRPAQRKIGQAPLSSSWRSLASPRDAFLDDEGPGDLLSGADNLLDCFLRPSVMPKNARSAWGRPS